MVPCRFSRTLKISGPYPTGGNNWAEFTPFLGYSPEIRRVIYSTNAVEALHARRPNAFAITFEGRILPTNA